MQYGGGLIRQTWLLRAHPSILQIRHMRRHSRLPSVQGTAVPKVGWVALKGGYIRITVLWENL